MSFLIVRRLVAVSLLVIFASVSIYPQSRPASPDEKPRKIKQEPKKAYVDWINDVEPILTEEERRAWKHLRTDEEREEFIQLFWRQRDPDPDTVENEYKEEYYERVAYADEHFASGKPGRLTDRGRIYIKFGKPDEIESHPAGGRYERPYYEGGGSTSTYPFEKWFYRYIPNVRSGVELEFVDPTGSGEYRLARNPDEKDALIRVPGAGPTIAEQLGLETRADRLTASGGFGRANYIRAQDSPFEVLTLQNDLQRVQAVERHWFGSTPSPIVDNSALSFETHLSYFRQSDNSVLTALTIQTDNRDLVFENSGGLHIARLNVYGRITSVADKRIGSFEDPVVTRATAEELTGLVSRRSAYAKAFVLQPGRYRIDIVVRDISSGATGVQRIGFQVPAFPAERLAVSSIVLAAKLESLKETVAGGPFAIGPNKVIPNLTGTYTRGQPVGIYFQVYNAVIDQTTLRPSVEVEYVLLKEAKELSRQREDWRDINDAGKRLTLTKLIDSGVLSPGEYEVQLLIQDQITGEKLTPSVKFTVVDYLSPRLLL